MCKMWLKKSHNLIQSKLLLFDLSFSFLYLDIFVKKKKNWILGAYVKLFIITNRRMSFDQRICNVGRD